MAKWPRRFQVFGVIITKAHYYSMSGVATVVTDCELVAWVWSYNLVALDLLSNDPFTLTLQYFTFTEPRGHGSLLAELFSPSDLAIGTTSAGSFPSSLFLMPW